MFFFLLTIYPVNHCSSVFFSFSSSSFSRAIVLSNIILPPYLCLCKKYQYVYILGRILHRIRISTTVLFHVEVWQRSITSIGASVFLAI